MKSVARKSILRTVEREGVGLHSGAKVLLRLDPAAAGSGIGFVREDLPGAPKLGLDDHFDDGPLFRTALKRGPVEVHTVEHLLSACAGLGLTDLTVTLNGPEIPGMDGSARPFVEALREAGIEVLPGAFVEPLVVQSACLLEDGPARIEALPHAEGLRISYTLDYPGEPLAQGSRSLEVDEESYTRELAPARTFCLRKEVDALRAAGMGKGAGTHNTLVLDGGQVLEATLRFPDEPVRHKMLDLVGDLYLLGRPVCGHLIAHRSGHRLNRAMARLLAKQCGA